MAMPPVTPTSTVRSPAGAVGVWPVTLRSVRGLVLDLVVDDLLEGDGEEVGAARVDERRRQLLDAHRVLAEAVVVAVDLPRALGGDCHDHVVELTGRRDLRLGDAQAASDGLV